MNKFNTAVVLSFIILTSTVAKADYFSDGGKTFNTAVGLMQQAANLAMQGGDSQTVTNLAAQASWNFVKAQSLARDKQAFDKSSDWRENAEYLATHPQPVDTGSFMSGQLCRSYCILGSPSPYMDRGARTGVFSLNGVLSAIREISFMKDF